MAVRAGGEALSGEIQVKLLGPLEVELAGEPIRFDGAKQRTLFVSRSRDSGTGSARQLANATCDAPTLP